MWKCPSKLKLDEKCGFDARRSKHPRALFSTHVSVTEAFGSSTVTRKNATGLGRASGFGYFSLPEISFTRSRCS